MANGIKPLDDKLTQWRDPRIILRTIQLILPLVLFGVVFVTEAQEHLSNGLESVNIHFVIEVIFFPTSPQGWIRSKNFRSVS